MMSLTFVQGDTAPDITAIIHEEDDPTSVIDLTDCTVRFQMRKADDKRYTNNTAAQDEFGEFDDYVEIYNPSGAPVDMSGKCLTDKADQLTQWQFPFGGVMLEAGGFLLIWCDEDLDQGPLHPDFKLSTNGEFIALVDTDGVTIIDSLSFGPQTSDISYGRYPNGADLGRYLPISLLEPNGAVPPDSPPVIIGALDHWPVRPEAGQNVYISAAVVSTAALLGVEIIFHTLRDLRTAGFDDDRTPGILIIHPVIPEDHAITLRYEYEGTINDIRYSIDAQARLIRQETRNGVTRTESLLENSEALDFSYGSRPERRRRHGRSKRKWSRR